METIDGGSSELPVRLAVVIDGGRASKKLITVTGDNELSSSVDVVVSNDDLLIEILLRSPAISIIQWKSVSKRWLSLISTPTFASRRSQSPKLDPPSGLFFRRDSKSSSEYDFVSLDTRIPAIRSPTNINFTMGSAAGKGNVEILHSCNGLLLCRMGTFPDKTVYVCNPSINQFKMLPQENYHSNIRGINGGIKMAFDPTKSPHYKVIHAAAIESRPSSIQIQIYSSETCNWTVCGVHFQPKIFKRFSGGIYWNDALYWLSWRDKVCYLKLNMQKPILSTVKIPKAMLRHCYAKLFESHGRLILVCNAYYRFQDTIIYEMRKEYHEWLRKYRVSLTPTVVKMYRKSYCPFVRAVVLREREDESFLVIEANGKMFKYNYMVETLSNLFDSSVDENYDGLQFIASFAGV